MSIHIIRWEMGGVVAGLCPQASLPHASLGVGRTRGMRLQLIDICS